MAYKKGEKIEKWIDLDKFAHMTNGRINWSESINITIPFIYGNHNGTIKILKITNGRKCIALISSNNYSREYEFNCSDIINCKFGSALTKPVALTHPELLKYFVDESDAYKYSSGSGIKINAICPLCGQVSKKSIKRLVERGFTCPRCSDGISWPNKFMFNILDQLGVNFDKEITKATDGFEWIQYNYRYDFCVWLKDRRILIEMDGHYHFEDRFKTCEETRHADHIKDNMAKEHGVDVIRIDCNYKDTYERFEYIRNNIVNSDLKAILDFDIVDWDMAHMFANNNSDIYLAAQYWNNGMNSQDIAKKLKTSKSSTRCYLIIASQLNLCDYNSQKSRSRGAKYRSNNMLYSKRYKINELT